jgi:hypothetical protein
MRQPAAPTPVKVCRPGEWAHNGQAFGADPHPVLLKAMSDSDHSSGGPSNISQG